MPKAELGEKQICPHCGAKFYDLGRRPAVCAKCHTAFDPADETLKPRRLKARASAFKAEAEEAEDEADAETERDPLAEDEEEIEEAPELDAVVDDPIDTGEEEEESADVLSPDALPPGFSEEDADLVDEDIAGGDDDDVLFEEDADFEEDAIEDVADGAKDDEI